MGSVRSRKEEEKERRRKKEREKKKKRRYHGLSCEGSKVGQRVVLVLFEKIKQLGLTKKIERYNNNNKAK